MLRGETMTVDRSVARAVWAVACLLAALASSARAQNFEVNRFRPTPVASDGLAVDGAETPGHLQLHAALTLDYAHRPLVVVLATGQKYGVITDQLALHGVFALGLGDRVAVFAGLPVNFLMQGDDPPRGIVTRLPRPEGAGFGDAYLGARVRVLGDSSRVVMLALQASLSLPLSAANASQLYSGDDGVGFDPRALLQINLGEWKLRGNVGVRLRHPQNLRGTEIGHELSYGLGAEHRLMHDRVRLLLDAYGASVLKHFADGTQKAAIEALVGARYDHVSGFYGGLGVGPGLTSGLGTPQLRALLTIGYASPLRADRDGDGLLDAQDRCPNEPEDIDGFDDADGCPDPDNDGDGVLDDQDKCPREQEDRDGVDDADGCPDGDDDADSIPDAQDKCPKEAEDRDGYADDDGCPDPDNDADRIPDAQDKCPNEAEDVDGFEDTDGCPDLDNDADGIPDLQDKCPDARGTADQQGCPASAVPMLRVTAERIEIPERVEFTPNQDVILSQSEPLLKQVAATIVANPQLTKLAVVGHTDSTGSAVKNLELSKRRAASVGRYLVKQGVGIQRLDAWGCGATLPVAPNDTDAGRQTNRRVEFRIATPAAGLPPSCQLQTF